MNMSGRALIVVACVAFPSLCVAQGSGTLEVTSSYDLPSSCGVPLQARRLILQRTLGGPPIESGTDLKGVAEIKKVPTGDYELLLADTMPVGRECITWKVPVKIERGWNTVGLTSANRTVIRPIADTTPSDTSVTNLALMRWDRSLVSVSAGGRIGTGIVVDRSGLILTSDHLAQPEDQITVSAVASKRVRAHVVSKDVSEGLAILLVPPDVVADRDVARLVPGPTAAEGTFVSLLSKQLDVASRVVWAPVGHEEAGRLVIHHPYTYTSNGGVAVAATGELVALIAARPQRLCGTPVPNAVRIERAAPLLARALEDAARTPMPDTSSLGAWPSEALSAAMLDSIADISPPNKYEGLADLQAGRFFVRIESPALDHVAQRNRDTELAKHIEQGSRNAEGEAQKCWERVQRPPTLRAAATSRAAVIEIHVDAAVRFGTGFTLYGLPIDKVGVFIEGDLESGTIFRNGEPVVPIVGGTDVRVHSMRLYSKQKKGVTLYADSAHVGYFVLPATAFAPDPDGAPPTIALYLPDARNPDEPSCLKLAPKRVAALWNDFVPLYAERTPAPVRADPQVKPTTPRPPPDKACPAKREVKPF